MSIMIWSEDARNSRKNACFWRMFIDSKYFLKYSKIKLVSIKGNSSCYEVIHILTSIFIKDLANIIYEYICQINIFDVCSLDENIIWNIKLSFNESNYLRKKYMLYITNKSDIVSAINSIIKN